MHLMYTVDASGKRVYTLRKIQAGNSDNLEFLALNHNNVGSVGEVTKSAHPARFSPDDKYSRQVS